MEGIDSPVVLFLSLAIVIFSSAALSVAGIYSIPFVWRRFRSYQHGVYRTYAFFLGSLILIPAICLLLFLGVGLTVMFVDLSPLRQLIIRLCIAGSVLLLAVQVILVPVFTSRIESEENGD